MTQDAVVTKLVSRHVAEVEVERGTACGGTCESCEACVFQNRIRAEAVNKVSALPGQKVVIESKTSVEDVPVIHVNTWQMKWINHYSASQP